MSVWITYANWNNLGLCFDILGTLALGLALIRQSDEHLYRKSASEWDWNRVDARDGCEQRADATLGVAYLSIGFILQLQPSFLPSSEIGLAVTMLAGVAIFGTYLGWARGIIVERALDRLQKIDAALFPPSPKT